jgi:hypothetical protein
MAIINHRNIPRGPRCTHMSKESRRKVKPKTSPPMYVSSDDVIDSSDGEDEDEEA